jgi:hypothetical protein
VALACALLEAGDVAAARGIVDGVKAEDRELTGRKALRIDPGAGH